MARAFREWATLLVAVAVLILVLWQLVALTRFEQTNAQLRGDYVEVRIQVETAMRLLDRIENDLGSERITIRRAVDELKRRIDAHEKGEDRR